MRSLVLIALLGLAWAQNTPNPCCTDQQFEVMQGQVGGTVYNEQGHLTQNWLDGYNIVHYDNYNKMVAVEAHQNLPNGTTTVTHYLQDFTHNKLYITAMGNCEVMPLNKPIRSPCIPASAKFLGETYMGYGTTRLRLNNWEYHIPNTDEILRVSVTANGCTPVIESLTGHIPSPDKTQMVETNLVYVFNGFTPGLKKPALFNIPTNCQPGSRPVGREIHAFNRH